MSIFYESDLRNSVIGLLNSKVANEILKILSPTMNFEVGHVSSIPFLKSNDFQGKNVDNCIEYAKVDWDSFEESWDFSTHFLI